MNRMECRLGALSYVYTLYADEKDSKSAKPGESRLAKIRHVQEGLRKRFDVMTIDFSLFLATIFAFAFAWFIPEYLGWDKDENPLLIKLLSYSSCVVLLLTFANWYLLKVESAKMIEGLFRFMARKGLSNGDFSHDFTSA